MSSLRHGRVGALVGVLACLASVVTCSGAGSAMPTLDGALAVGTWGGDSAGMIVSDATTHLHIGCTFGDVVGRIPLDAHGEFDVAGSYLLRAYPIAVGPTLPARFVGRLDRTSVTVTVTIDDTINKQTVVRGPAVVTLGTEPRLGPCPICKQPAMARRIR